MRRNQILCGLGTLMLAVAPAAHATLLSPALANLKPSGFSSLPSISLIDDTTGQKVSNPIGALAASAGLEIISNTGPDNEYALTGSFISEVYQDASGTLDFYYQVSIAPSSTSSLEDLAVSDFLALRIGSPNGVNVGHADNVAFYGAAVPFSAPTYPDDRLRAGTLNLNWEGLPLSGEETPVVFAVPTNEMRLGFSTTTSVDGTGGTSDDLFDFQPLSSVPEPVSLVLLGTTLALAALFIRRRHPVKVSKAEIKS